MTYTISDLKEMSPSIIIPKGTIIIANVEKGHIFRSLKDQTIGEFINEFATRRRIFPLGEGITELNISLNEKIEIST